MKFTVPMREFPRRDPFGFDFTQVVNARKRVLLRRWLISRGIPRAAVINLTVWDLQRIVKTIRRLNRMAVLKDRAAGNILNITDRGPVERQLCGKLRQSIAAHGPVTWANAPSAASRVYAGLKELSRQQRQGSDHGAQAQSERVGTPAPLRGDQAADETHRRLDVEPGLRPPADG